MHQVSRCRARRALGALLPALLLVVSTVGAVLDTPTVRHAYTIASESSSGIPHEIARERDHVAIAALETIASKNDALFSLRYEPDIEDVVVSVAGRGRHWSNTVSIAHTEAQQVVAFSPPVINVRWTEACEPTMHIVHAENRATDSLRVIDVRLDHAAFKLATDPRNAVVAPGERLELKFLVVADKSEGLNTHVVLATSIGEFILPVQGEIKHSTVGLEGLRVSLPPGVRFEHDITVHNPDNDVLRITEVFSLDSVGDLVLPSARGEPTRAAQWNIAPQSSKTIARFVFSGPPGHYQSTVRVFSPKKQHVVPIQIDVWEDELVIEPRGVDLGVFAHDNERREVLFTFHNTGPQPVTVDRLRIVEADGVVVQAELQGPMPIIPPRSRVRHTVRLNLQSKRHGSGPCRLRLEFATNSAGTAGTYSVDLHGFSTRGRLSYSLSQSVYRVVEGVINPGAWIDADYQHIIIRGSSSLRRIQLRNAFDTAIEILHVQLVQPCDGVSIESYSTAIVPQGDFMPNITLKMDLTEPEVPQTRICSLRVESNVTVHHIPMFLYPGMTRIATSRAREQRAEISSPTCDFANDQLPLDDPAASSINILAQRSHPDVVRSCRTVWLPLGKVARTGRLEELVNITNMSPLGISTSWQVTVSSTLERAMIQVTSSKEMDTSVPIELSMIGAAWRRTVSKDKHTTELAPGEKLILRIQVDFEGANGTFTDHVATVETDFETIAIYVQYEAVEGTIAPVVRSVEIPAIFPGRMGLVDLPFESSFDHDVSTVSVYTDGDGHTILEPLHLQASFPANATSFVSMYFFAPKFFAACRRGAFYADCYTPHPVNYSEYSGYGSRVTHDDLQALDHREREWARYADESVPLQDHGRHMSMNVYLRTEAVHADPVHVTMSLVRPPFFARGESMTASLQFPLTEVLQDVATMYIDLFNPSDFDIDVELAISESDRHIFYACDDDLTDAECLHEWQDIAREPSSTPTAPLFLRSRVVRANRRSPIRLGPVYFFPSTVGEWSTRIFVRNELTHIESVALQASSGVGELVTTLLKTNGSTAVVDEAEADAAEVVINANHTLIFTMSGVNESTPSLESTQTLELTNRGSYPVQVKYVGLASSTSDRKRSGFSCQPIKGMELAPNSSLGLPITVTFDCYRSRQENQLEIVTRGDVKRVQLVALLAPTEAFNCRMQQWAGTLIQYVPWSRAAVVLVGVITAVAALLSVTVDTRRRRCGGGASHVATELTSSRQATETTVAINGQDAELLQAMQQVEAQACVRKPIPRKAKRVEKLRAARASKTEDKTRPVPGSKQPVSGQIDPGVPSEMEIHVSVQRDHHSLDHAEPTAIDVSHRVDAIPASDMESKPASPRDRTRVSTAVEVGSTLAETVVHASWVHTKSEEPEDEVTSPSSVDTLPPRSPESTSNQVVEETRHVKQEGNDPTKQTAAVAPEAAPEGVVAKDVNSKHAIDRLLPSNQDDHDMDVVTVFPATPYAAAVGMKEQDAEKESGSTRDDTVSEEESDNQALDATSICADDLADAPFSWPVDLVSDLPLVDDQTFATTSMDDDWSALSFDSLQHEIGRLLVVDDTTPFGRELLLSGAPLQLGPAVEPTTSTDVLGGLSMAPPLLPMSSLFGGNTVAPLPVPTRSTSAKPAPPGFTPADADPEASRAAFERLIPRPQPVAPLGTSTNRGDRMQSAFAGRYSLFGSVLEPDDTSVARPVDGVGRIGGRRAGPRSIVAERPFATPLAALGGTPLPADNRKGPRPKGTRY